MSAVRTRFAPSPTGFLHIGAARTALFNWAFARRLRGRMVLRIEDTDRERSTRDAETGVIEGLSWLGIEWDEGPIRQSERAERYAEAVDSLLRRDRAYRCVCTREQIDERRRATIAAGGKWTYDGRCRDAGHGPSVGPHTVRLRLPQDGRLGWDDLVFGPSGQDAGELGDMIIRRSDGSALYNLAVVVDDADTGITHVIRGADHHSNTPLQLAIYDALGLEPPHFAHVPLIVGEDDKKLSKRRDPVSIQQYRDSGYLPEALVNWLVRIGWSHGDQEIFSRDEIASLFDLESVNRASARADAAKLLWLNQHYIKTLPRERLLVALLPYLEAAVGRPCAGTPGLEPLVELLRDRSKTLVDMARLARFVALDDVPYEQAASDKHLSHKILAALEDLHDALLRLDGFSEPAIEKAFQDVLARHGDLKMGRLAQPVRVAVTGGTVSPGIFETLAVLGKERTVGRIAEAIHYIRHGA